MKNKEQIAKIWDVLDSLNVDVLHNKQAIIKLENEREQPQLKQLDQSVFDGLDEKWRFAAVDKNGSVYKFRFTPKVSGDSYFCDEGYHKYSLAGKGYDATDWQNSLIERDKVELTGSDLALELLKNQRYIIASVSDVSDADAIECGNNKLIYKSSEDIFTDDMGGIYCWAVALNNQGEPLTAAEAGL